MITTNTFKRRKSSHGFRNDVNQHRVYVGGLRIIIILIKNANEMHIAAIVILLFCIAVFVYKCSGE